MASAEEIPENGMKGFTVEKTRVLIAKVNGEYYAIGAICTHLGGLLDNGKLDGNVVTCPLHGSRFDVTNGSVVRQPAKVAVRAYKVTRQGDSLLVEM
jgi:nitrite reductase/ring-hydroxylating ferredoxin subunit